MAVSLEVVGGEDVPSIVVAQRASSVSSAPDCWRKAAVSFLSEDEKFAFGIGPSYNNASAAVGTAMHKAIEHCLRIKKGGTDFTMKDLSDGIDKGIENFDKEIAQNALWDKTTPHIDTAHRQIQAMSRAAVPVLRTIEPLHIEQYFESTVSPLGEQAAVKIKITAHLDLVDVVKTLWDHKSGASVPTPFGQFGCYITVAEKNDCPIDKANVLYIPRLGVTKLDEVVARVVPFDRNECVRVARTTIKSLQWYYEQWLEAKAKTGECDPSVFPVNPSSRLCTPNYCRAYGSGFCAVGGANK